MESTSRLLKNSLDAIQERIAIFRQLHKLPENEGN